MSRVIQPLLGQCCRDSERSNRTSVNPIEPGVPRIKLFWWRHARRIIKTLLVVLVLLGLGLLVPGLLVPVYGLKIAGICVLVVAAGTLFMRRGAVFCRQTNCRLSRC